MFIFDDLEVTEEYKNIIADLFMRRRTNLIFISNGYFYVPGAIMETSEYAIFTRIPSHGAERKIRSEFDVKEGEEYTYKLLKKNYLK